MRPSSFTRLLLGISAAALCLCTVAAVAQQASAAATARSVYASHDVALSLNPASAFWQAAGTVRFDRDTLGHAVPGLGTEVRSRWTQHALYLLFVCHYDQLFLKPDPVTTSETDRLWNWDVAETFIGSDFADIRRYKEFEISPQGEYVDLDINLSHPLPHGGLGWNSGFANSARIDRAHQIWYGAMRIPFTAITPAPVRVGSVLRINFFRAQGAPPNRHLLAWNPPMGMSFHVPEKFGTLRLAR